ncbi:hypothetical protein KEM54_001210 [Ascosphaera aggregata]|nr:hypothetical protein KEM54_001210 [Ascosphaera aggregata]
MSILNRFTEAQDALSDEVLIHLKSYKYSSVDKSPISYYILRHYWNAFVELLPMWMAPNVVTLLGFAFIIGNLLLLELFISDLVGPGPGWVYVSFAIGMWMYSTLDNVDGKQARRTGSSSPLGELFDHGIDSLNCTLASLFQVAALAMGSTKSGAFVCLLPCLPMYLSTWETYHTHTLYLGYVNGPTEGLIIATLMILASGIWGPQIYQQRAVDTLGHPELFGECTFQDIFVFVLGFSFLFTHLPACVYNVWQARQKEGLSLKPALMEWIPISLCTFATVAWLWSPYSTLLEQNRLVLFAVTISFVFGRMTTKIILYHLTKQPFPWWTTFSIPLYGGAILANLPRLGLPRVSAGFELFYLRCYLTFAFVAYMYWALFTINRICTFLGIGCLTIKEDKSRARDQVYRNFGGVSVEEEETSALPESEADVRLKNH